MGAEPHLVAAPGPLRGRAGTRSAAATVLFVDDEPQVLSGLRRALHQVRPSWQVLVAGSGEEALQVLAAQAVDVVVSDMRMPGMNGAELLARVHDEYPAIARIILSGYSDRESVIAAVGPTQQFLGKPCDSTELVTVLDRVLTLQDLVTDPHLRDVLGGVTALPKPPQIYERITALTANADYDLDELVAVIRSDLATSAEVLRLVNSSFFGLPTRVDSLARAVGLLGPDTIQALAISSGLFMANGHFPSGLDPIELSTHGLVVATVTRRVAEADGWLPDDVADMFAAGLLHEVGLPVLAAAHPDRWRAVRQAVGSSGDVVLEHTCYLEQFGCAPTQASAYLLGLWGFPEPVIRAIAEQPALPADPSATPAGLLLTYARHHALNPCELLAPAPEGGYLDAARMARWRSFHARSDVPAGPGAPVPAPRPPIAAPESAPGPAPEPDPAADPAAGAAAGVAPPPTPAP